VSLLFPAAGRVRALVLASAVACASAAASPVRPARADDPAGEAGVVEEIVVVGRRPRAQVAQDPTAAATVIEAERFSGEAKGVAELVATAPGVAVSAYGGLGQLSTVSVRGSTSSGVLVLLDGIPLNTAAGGGVDLSSVPRTWISRIEVARGAEGAHYGVGALGGVVNVVTRPATAGAWSAEASGGSFGTFSAAVDGGARRDGWAFLAQASAEGSDGDFPFVLDQASNTAGTATDTRRNNEALRAGALVKALGHRGASRVDAFAHVTAGRRELAGWPHTSDRDWQRDARALLAARLAAPGPAAGLVLAGRAHVRADVLQLSLEDLFDGRATTQRGGAGGLAAEALWSHGSGVLRAGASAEGEVLSSSAVGGTRGRGAFSVSASEELALLSDRLRLAPALRAERVGPFSGLSGKLGASLRVAGPVALRASAGQTFRPPSFAELHMEQGLVMPNPDLRSERGLGADAGVVVDGRLGLATLGVHATLYDELIQYQATGFGRLKPFNAGKAVVRGLEAEAATAPLRAALGLSLSASYTLLDTERLRGPPEEVGRDLTFRPRHRLYARAAIAPGPATAHLEAHHVSAQWRDARNVDLRVPEALLWNAGASVRALRRPDVRVHLELRNLLDDRTLADPLGGPLPGRTVMLTVRAAPPSPEGRP
jgi:iron complex outermembrane receptor protein